MLNITNASNMSGTSVYTYQDPNDLITSMKKALQQ